MKKFFAAIGQFLKTNYWLQPLLLVVIVFVLVFSLQGFDSVIESIKNWISPHSKCSECTSLKYDKAKARVQALEKDKAIYIFIYEDKCDACKTIYKKFNTFIKANKIDVLAINVGIKETDKLTEKVTYYDTTLGADPDENGHDELAELTEEVRLYLVNYTSQIVGKSAYSYTLTKPSLIRYVNKSSEDGVRVEGVITETSSFNADGLRTFTNPETYE
ncbi:MAG: hypothetical protein ACOX0I_01710 [Bacilli bacterium]|jgi:hypothetical protein